MKDSACDPGLALIGAYQLVQTAFSGLGADAVIGASCSGASMTAAEYLQLFKMPQLSPASTSAALSDSATYPYLVRTPPSDAWQSFALADVVEHLLGVERLATVNSEDTFGASGMQQFKISATRRGLRLLASTSFANFQEDLSSSVEVLRRSGALVVVLFCQTEDASRFIQAMQAAGAHNITYVGPGAVTLAVRAMVADSPEQEARLRGFVGTGQSGGEGEAYTAFRARLNAFQATIFNESWCSPATDDDGRLLWATADGGCPWAGGDVSADFYAPFAYDAVYAMALAMSRTLAAANATSIDGETLLAQMLNLTFRGASGLVGFDEHGDRDVGLAYEVYNVANQGMAMLGRWQQGATWSSRFTSSASYVAADGSSRAPELASAANILSLGVLCKDAESEIGSFREQCDHVMHTVDRINDKADGWYDNILPNHTIVTATRSVGCVEGRAQRGWLELQESLPGFTAVIGPDCSNDIADVAGLAWRNSTGNRAVVLGTSSTAPQLSNDAEYPNLARAVSTDEKLAEALVNFCVNLGWDRVAILHDDTVWAAGSAAAFQASFAAHGEVLHGGLVSFSLSAFRNGSVHARDLLSRLDAASARVIFVATQPWVQRAIYAYAYDHKILFGPGFGFISSWVTEQAFSNDDGSVNTSTVQGAEGLIGLRPPMLAYSAVAESMVELWRAASSTYCDGLSYCDADGDPARWVDYSSNAVDAVLLYAHGMDTLRRDAPHSINDPDALYAAILAQPTFDGLAGPVTLGPDGDRLGRYEVVNFQVCSGGAGSQCGRRRQLSSSISLSQTVAAFVTVGTYDTITRNLTVSWGDLVFSQGTVDVPVTSMPPSQPPSQPPSPPPALPPALPTIITEDRTWILVTILVTIPISILLVTCVFALKMRKALRRARARAKDAQRARLLDALDTTRSLQFPGVLVQLADFVTMGRLEPFEKLRDSGVRLRYFDGLEQLESSGGCKVVFLSHQWTSFSEPDPTGDQYRVMLSSIAHVMDVQDWNPDRVLVWCDYCSVPQGHKGMQGFAINSIASYAACADAFIVVAPDVPHSDLPGVMCDVEQYKKRLWTRVEQLCPGLANGSHHMWVATSLTECRKAAAEENWLSANLRVFDGEATDEYDKLTLVLPLLGLYAQIYATHSSQHRASPQQSSAGGEKTIQHPLVWRELCEHKQEIFPARLVIRPRPKPQKLAEPDTPSFNSSRDGSFGAPKTTPKMVRHSSSLNRPSALTVSRMDRLRFARWRSGGVARSDGSLTFELFGGLVEAMEQLLDEDIELHGLV